MVQQGQAKNDRFDQAYDDMQGEVETTLTGASQWLVVAIGDTGFYIPCTVISRSKVILELT